MKERVKELELCGRRLIAFPAAAATALAVFFFATSHELRAQSNQENRETRHVRRVPGHAMGATSQVAAIQVPPRVLLAERLEAADRLTSAAAGAVDELSQLRTWNRSGRLPTRNGLVRVLAREVAWRNGSAGRANAAASFEVRSLGGARVLATRVEVSDAYRLRLLLEDVSLPAGTQMWVRGENTVVGPFGLELSGPDGTLWTPSVGGPFIELEVQFPEASVGPGHSVAIRQVLELLEPAEWLDSTTQAGTECLIDGACEVGDNFAPVEEVRAAVAQLQFDGFVCTGSLLNDATASETPFLLTANHCFSDQSSASALEVFWDYRNSSCNAGDALDFDQLPRSNGATLLASEASSDVTLVRLQSVPSGRFFLGWDATPAVDGEIVHRLSHPAPGVILPQSYASYRVDTSVATCPESPRSHFIHSKNIMGASFGGSSGSPLMLGNGLVIGQLTGACGPDPIDGCNFGNTEVDGAFSASYEALAPFLAPGLTEGCDASETQLCIDDQAGDARFAINSSYSSATATPPTGTAQAISLESLGVGRGGLFWFFGRGNPEILVKVLNGCAINSHYWVLFAATTTVGFDLTVTDTHQGTSRTWSNTDGVAAEPVVDLVAFRCDLD